VLIRSCFERGPGEADCTVYVSAKPYKCFEKLARTIAYTESKVAPLQLFSIFWIPLNSSRLSRLAATSPRLIAAWASSKYEPGTAWTRLEVFQGPETAPMPKQIIKAKMKRLEIIAMKRWGIRS
tara:strand:+ start:832 stop:1203 length:372 start_codon:yes stop_codon:yes gene_type:complete